MAPQDTFSPLRVVTQRLSSTPIRQLPHVAPYLATTITQHGQALAMSTKNGKVASETESAVIVHKLKTQLSALLQDKNAEARYAAVILIKASVEVGGWNVLQGVGAWVRGLIGILGKLDPPSTKKLCIILLTRIFLLTHEHQSLVREITTPSLPGFITACLNLTKDSRSPETAADLYAQSPLLLVVLHALSELVAMHPTSFRPFVPLIQSLTHPLIAPTPSNLGIGNASISTSTSVSESARHLFVLLHVCGPRNTAGEEWARSLDVLIISVQRTADKVFRSLIEDSTSSTGKYYVTDSNLLEDVVCDQAPTPLALPAWTGIHAGIERLDGLLHTLQAFLATATAAVVTLPVGSILSSVDRVLSISPPGNGRNPRFKPEITRDEREGLWVGLPRLQISALGVCSLMISRMGHSSAAIAPVIMEQLLWAFESQNGNHDFRQAAYRLVSQILSAFGSSLPRIYATPLSRCIRMCCEDLLPSAEPQVQNGQPSYADTQKSSNGVTGSMNADSFLESRTNQVDVSVASINLLQAAQELLPLTLTNLPNDFLPFSLRCQIDRTAIIIQNRKAMLASVMNPNAKGKWQKQTSSILPLLARAHPGALETEALLRPQMPPIESRRNDGRDMEFDEEEDTYMHDHLQNGESDGHYHDLGGANENANVEENILLGHSSVQVEATSGAVEERSPSMEPTSVFRSTATGLSEPKPAFSYTPTKRDREENSDSDKQATMERDSMEQIEIGMASKRARMGLDETLKENLLKPASADPAVVDTGRIGETVKKESASDFVAVSDRQSVLQQGDSDESEFEMPVLNLDPDTDEEEEEEEEEDD